MLISGCGQEPVLERIKNSGQLLVGTRYAPTTYIQGANNLQGPEYEMVQEFASQLSLTAKFIVYDSNQALVKAVTSGEVHMAAAGLAITPRRSQLLRFSIPYDSVSHSLLYRKALKQPASLAKLPANRILVAAHGSPNDLLDSLVKKGTTDIQWQTRINSSEEQLIADLDLGLIDYTLADSNQIKLAQRYYANIRSAFKIGDDHDVAWAFSRAYDDSLIKAANQFLTTTLAEGSQERLFKKYYDLDIPLNFVGMRAFWRKVKSDLPKYQQWFMDAGNATGYDWRLLAAIGYQESHWNPEAVSPTGVKGLMMLTKDAAAATGVKQRKDPQQSINGGARYLRIVEKKIPERITGDDRIWFMLAGYNIGFGHLEDARILTQRQGGNPDIWDEVKARLPLLAKEKYYSTLKNGYARGPEPVVFVRNIRFFYELLVWWDNQP